uniref:DUF1460 domain-containing protein n=1 Tax=Panagrellus redivivus TaxID=6233 RepID=A0A7E4VWS2_PANRE
MAQLKEHMLREIATNLCHSYRYIRKRLITLENFILSGKEPARVFCQIVARNITIRDITSNNLRVLYRGESWWHKRSFLDILMIKFARKVHMDSFRGVYESAKLGYSKLMAENTGWLKTFDFFKFEIEW